MAAVALPSRSARDRALPSSPICALLAWHSTWQRVWKVQVLFIVCLFVCIREIHIEMHMEYAAHADVHSRRYVGIYAYPNATRAWYST